MRWLAAVCCLVPVFPALAGDVKPPQKYVALVRELESFIAQEVKDKKLLALSIALVDDQHLVWSRGFGHADPSKGKPATSDTVYRVGSVSKLFTDLAILQLAEQGKLDLDAPVSRYLPDFKPKNPHKTEITLRHLMAHRSGLIRESPVGNYFDPSGPTLADTVKSLNGIPLVLEPGKKIKYSNSAIAVVGYVVETLQKTPFAEHLQKAILGPLDMGRSGFAPRPELTRDLAKAVMWTYHGREFPAPTFELGMAPAGCMYSTVNDLGKFLSALFADGQGARGRVLKAETLEAMYKPQFAEPEAKTGFGLGFRLGQFQGKRRLGHGGAIYGFATELAFLPDEKLGVVVICSRDVANGLMTRIADTALEGMLALKQGKELPKIARPEPIKPELARKLAGTWTSKERTLDLIERDGRLFLLPRWVGLFVEVRALGEELIVDDVQAYGVRLKLEKDRLTLAGNTFERRPDRKPEPCPKKWLGLIGEYGWDHNTLYIFEMDGQLFCLIEWVFIYPLQEESENVFAFPNFGLYHDEKILFTRDKSGKATRAEAASVVFARRKLDGENGKTFRITPRRPIETIRKESLAATPPRQAGEFARPELVDLASLDKTLRFDIRYAGTNNFLGVPFYASARAFLQKPAAEALLRVHRKLKESGYGLLIHDAYRPWQVTRMFWEATPERHRLFVADPSQGSRHNRGCAVDLTLYDLKTGQAVEMVGGYDEFSDRSYPGYWGGTSLQRWHRDLLRRSMEAEGFKVYEAEWWHFDYRDWKKYPLSHPLYAEANKALLGKNPRGNEER